VRPCISLGRAIKKKKWLAARATVVCCGCGRSPKLERLTPYLTAGRFLRADEPLLYAAAALA